MPTLGRMRLLVWVALLFSSLVSAEEIRDYYAEPGLNPFKETVNQHFNEHVDPFSGTLQLKYTDLSIPGNGGMDINVTRVYTSLQTNQYPKLGLNGLGWVMHFGRIVVPRQYASTLCNQTAFPFTTRENPSLELPDGGRELLVINNITGGNTLITRSNWRAQCGPNGIGLIVTSPDGTRYTMNQYDVLHDEPSWLTTRIEDLEGNWIRIAYKTNALGISYIDAIYRSEEGDTTPVVRYVYQDEDGAGIRLASISANAQSVHYSYELIPGFLLPNYYQLVEVVRPDGRSWNYSYNPKLGDPDPDDDVLEDGLASFSLIHVDYPHGAGIDYTYQHVAFDPGDPMQKATSIRTKTVSGSAVAGGQWTYDFAPHSAPFDDGFGGQLRYDVTTVTGPDDILKFYHNGKDYRTADRVYFISPSMVGLLVRREVYSRSNALIERTGYSWGRRLVSTEKFWHGSGYRSWWTDEDTYAPILLGEFTNRDSRASAAGFNHHKQYFEHDVYGNPGRIVESTNLSDRPQRQVRLTYHIDPVKWIVQLAADEVHEELASNGTRNVGEIDRTFDANGKLLREVALGVETNYTYTDNGDVATVEDARGNVRRYSSYKRGIAQLERLPESVTIEREVNDTGTVKSQTNGRGYTTSFQYDELNRLTAIDFPAKADVSISYSSVGGGYRRTLTRGGYRQSEDINDFAQVKRIERRDTVSDQEIFVTRQYDASGRQTFVSYPNSTVGITTSHDALGRTLRTEHPDQSGVDYVYDDAEVRVTNERGIATTYTYHIRGIDFAAMSLSIIRAPENVGTLIFKNAFDNTTRLFQGESLSNGNVRGYGKDYEYDARQFLVSSIEPEVGTTVFTHDALGNVLSERVNDAEPITFVYDNLNRRTHTDFPGSTPDVVASFDANGNVRELIKGDSHWRYEYDENDNLLTESLTVSDALLGTRNYVTSNAYSNLDVLSQITYPSGLAVDYAPDSFGRATRAGTFVTNVTYHPSGQLQSYRMANGVTTNVTLNERLITESITSGALVNLSYTYDPVGNVTSMIDGVDASRSVQMLDARSYDGLDRLLSVNGPWGNARFSYDFWGNMLTKAVGNDSLSNDMDDQRRLRQVTKINPNDSSRDLARTRLDFDTRGNSTAKRRYAFDTSMRVVELDERQFRYDAASNLISAKVTTHTSSQVSPVVVKEYVYDGNGQRIVEKKHRSYDIRYSVYASSGSLLFEDSIADCTRTDYIRLGALTLARSDDRFADPALDSDGDQINNCLEQQLGLNPNNAADAAGDLDGDGLSNLLEVRGGSSLLAGDTDRDGLSDFQETNQYLTDPTLADTDGDGLNDAVEAGNPDVDPVLADKDHDGVSDYWELQLGTHPENPADGRQDGDGDGFSNRQESLLGSDPTRAVASPARGREAWSFEALGRILTSAAIGPDGTIYVTADLGNMYAINPDGTQRWRYTVADRSLSAPIVAPDGTIYVAVLGTGGAIHAINTDGTRRWEYLANNPAGVVLGTEGRVYFTAYTIQAGPSGISFFGRWGSLDASGQFVAGAGFGDAVTYAPAVAANGNVYLIDASGVMRGYDAEGTLLWTESIVNDLSEPAAAPVIGTGQTIYFADDRGRTYALSPEGQILWTRQSPDQQTRSTVTVGSNGTLYIGAYDSKLYAVNDQDGSTLWEIGTAGTAYTPAVAADGTVYVTTFGGSISAFSPSGQLVWIHKTETEVSAPPVLDRDGTLYFGSRTGQLFAVVDNGGGIARTAWPMSRHDSAGTSYQCFNDAAYSISADSDGDGISDCAELGYGLDPSNPNDAAQDADGDGLTNAQEHAAGTQLDVADSDGDGLNDGQEVLTHHTDPLHVDSDRDSISDGQEIQFGLDPRNGADALADADGDGFSNRQESWAGTDLLNAGSQPAAGSVALQVNDSSMPMRSVAVAADGTIYQNSSTGLEALNPDFSVKWTWPTPIIGHPVIGADGTLYVVTTRVANVQRLVALFPNGTQRWSHSVAAPSTSVGLYEPPVLGVDGTLYLGVRSSDSAGDLILAVNSKGRPVWGNGVRFSGRRPKLAIGLNGDVIAHDGASGIRAYDAASGTQRWANTTSVGTGSEFSAPAIDTDGTIYMSNSAGLHAIAPVSGVRQWAFAGARGEPVITPNGLILQYCGTQRALCAISRPGALAWTAAETYTFAGTPMVASGGSIYVATRNNAFVSYSGAGVRLSEATLNSSGDATYPVILIDGTIYLGATGQRVLIVSGASGLADSPWPTRNRDNRNSRNTAHIVPVPPNPAPSVVITAPGSGATVGLDVAEPLAVSAYAVDMTDGELSANVEWSSNLEGSLGAGASLSLTTLRVGTHTITATATDSSNLSGTDTFTATVGIVPPTISISAPTTGAQFERGAAVTLRATANDRVDGDLSAGIEWSSNLDGPLGTAATLTVTTLQAGQHTITARVADSSGTQASASVQIRVEIIPPNLQVHSPTEGRTYEQGTSVNFNAEAYDNADGDLSDGIQWSSNRDGVIGIGAELSSSTLSLGAHVITASVRDSSNAEASQTRNITIGLVPPELFISSPRGFIEVNQGDEILFEASANDGLDGDLSANIRWVSPLDGPLHTGASFSATALSVGWHLVSATVTDSSGLTATETVYAIVNSPNNDAPFVVIEAPRTDTEIYVNDSLTFSAIAFDNQEGEVSANVRWSSSLQGVLGAGPTITVGNLLVGDHIINALVTDSAGAKGAEEIAVKVLPTPTNYPPKVTIASLGLNAFYTVDSTIPLTAVVTDRENGDLGASLIWSSNLDGELGRGAAIRVSNLTAGEHVITATATDNGGLTTHATGTITINADGQAYHMYDPFDISIGPDALAGWRVVDNAPMTRSSRWRSNNGVAMELNAGYSGSLGSTAIDKLGTYLLQTSGAQWTDYRVNALLSSAATNSFGLMFRVRDDNNYYRFSMDRDRSFRRLVKRVNGVFTTIWQDTTQYVQNRPYQLEVTVQGTTITVSLDGVQLYSGIDNSHLRGSIGLYAYASGGAGFDNVEVENLTTANMNHAPLVNINSPANNATVVEGRIVTFTATSEDAEDGTLSNTINWFSDIDGLLGSGSTLNVSTLSLGTHTITARSTDSDNLTGTSAISLTVNQFVNHTPVVTIVSPANGTTYGAGDLIAFSASATDEEDGDLTSSITWTSSINGALGSTGQFSTSTLSTGTHTITARATDSLGASHAPTIAVTIGAARPVLLSRDFNDRSLGGMTIATDAGTSGGPPVWSATTQAAAQTSQIVGNDPSATGIPRLGTFMYWTSGTNWTNYTVEADLRSSDPDTLGIMFRYLDFNNYYRFSMDRALSQRRLVKRVGGTFTLLKQDTVAYNLNQTYRVSISAHNGTITLMIDGQVFYTGTDTGVARGSVAFYCWRNGGATFDNLVVRSLTATASTLAPDEALDDQVGEMRVPQAEAAEQDDLPLAQRIEIPIERGRVSSPEASAVEPPIIFGTPAEGRSLTAFLMDQSSAGGSAP